MGRKKDRSFLLLVSVCSVAGAVLFGTASWAESNTCLQSESVTQECLTKTPTTKTLEGMGFGMFAGIGAAIASTWQIKRKS